MAASGGHPDQEQQELSHNELVSAAQSAIAECRQAAEREARGSWQRCPVELRQKGRQGHQQIAFICPGWLAEYLIHGRTLAAVHKALDNALALRRCALQQQAQQHHQQHRQQLHQQQLQMAHVSVGVAASRQPAANGGTRDSQVSGCPSNPPDQKGTTAGNHPHHPHHGHNQPSPSPSPQPPIHPIVSLLRERVSGPLCIEPCHHGDRLVAWRVALPRKKGSRVEVEDFSCGGQSHGVRGALVEAIHYRNARLKGLKDESRQDVWTSCLVECEGLLDVVEEYDWPPEEQVDVEDTPAQQQQQQQQQEEEEGNGGRRRSKRSLSSPTDSSPLPRRNAPRHAADDTHDSLKTRKAVDSGSSMEASPAAASAASASAAAAAPWPKRPDVETVSDCVEKFRAFCECPRGDGSIAARFRELPDKTSFEISSHHRYPECVTLTMGPYPDGHGGEYYLSAEASRGPIKTCWEFSQVYHKMKRMTPRRTQVAADPPPAPRLRPAAELHAHVHYDQLLSCTRATDMLKHDLEGVKLQKKSASGSLAIIVKGVGAYGDRPFEVRGSTYAHVLQAVMDAARYRDDLRTQAAAAAQGAAQPQPRSRPRKMSLMGQPMHPAPAPLHPPPPPAADAPEADRERGVLDITADFVSATGKIELEDDESEGTDDGSKSGNGRQMGVGGVKQEPASPAQRQQGGGGSADGDQHMEDAAGRGAAAGSGGGSVGIGPLVIEPSSSRGKRHDNLQGVHLHPHQQQRRSGGNGNPSGQAAVNGEGEGGGQGVGVGGRVAVGGVTRAQFVAMLRQRAPQPELHELAAKFEQNGEAFDTLDDGLLDLIKDPPDAQSAAVTKAFRRSFRVTDGCFLELQLFIKKLTDEADTHGGVSLADAAAAAADGGGHEQLAVERLTVDELAARLQQGSPAAAALSEKIKQASISGSVLRRILEEPDLPEGSAERRWVLAVKERSCLRLKLSLKGEVLRLLNV
ncbi:unnamed protein product [Vitrella brassicaformis CCMP3155]|uniref:Uncharacterized protein n=1 Tax=Vitrella brassicaformis (strain CCMP3155) TaxID=1169540 RepID=A0A0G4EQB1_VITBC|nr:unnamed protein product [Vitrella brassicaformis CCMP3155]|eukprot:CEL99614.1 unnamed protein product [Vitrella brassicaformis CCMP3155]